MLAALKAYPNIFPRICRVRSVAGNLCRVNDENFAGMDGKTFTVTFVGAGTADYIMQNIEIWIAVIDDK